MSLAVNAIPSVVAAQGVAGDVAFRPGSVVAAQVLQVSPGNQVRLAIAGQTIDVQSQVPLLAGQTLQLAVSQTADGIRLAIVAPQASRTGSAQGSELATLLTTLAASKSQLTPTEAVAVSNAAQTAVTQQASLANLFANLGAATSLANLPPKLQQAVAQVLAQRPALDAQLTGGEVKAAFQGSGLFLEATLAQGAPQRGALPDMKAALIVLKQALSTALASGAQGSPTTAAATLPAVAPAGAVLVEATAATLVPAVAPKPGANAELADPALPGAAAEIAEPELHAGLSAAAGKTVVAAVGSQPRSPAGTIAAAMAELMHDGTLPADLPPGRGPQGAPAEALLARPQVPPPPLRGGLPSAQPMVQPTLPPDAPPDQAIRHLLADTDAALARQTLHQLASLPDRADAASARVDGAASRWSFDIPFAMPNGTAVAQFEIARDDGQGTQVDAARKVWRARFSLDIEPAGPVHALVSLSGDRTSVRMWAERPATARQLQAGTAQLGQALIRANLQPGDIVVREGAPVQPAPAAAGHFLDRAL